MSIRKPHNNLAGYIFERRHPLGYTVCFNAEEAGIDTEHKYVVTLECIVAPSAIGPSFTSLPKAREFVKLELSGANDYDWQHTGEYCKHQPTGGDDVSIPQ